MINNLDELKGKISLLELVNENIMTKKKGNNYLGLCPFHQENTASFSVDSEKNVFHCFGCHESGDAIHYYQKLNNLDFLEAIDQLAEKYGVTLDKAQTEKQKEIASKQEIAYKLLGQLNIQFQAQLNQNVKDYLTKRKINENTIKTFGLGYGGSVKIENKEIARELGILKGNNFVYQDRLIIPIRNKNGLIIALNARTLTKQDPKYIHSPNSLLWEKKDTLFGLSEAIPLIKKQDKVYIVEGCFDVMSAWQNDIPAVACLGSALNKKQLTELLKLTDNIIFCLDEDKAGRNAIYKTIESIFEEILAGVFTPQILILKDKDMSDYFLKYEVTDFNELQIMDWVQWVFEYYRKTEKNPFLSVTKLISKFHFVAEKQKYIKLASELLEGDTKFLERELSRALLKPLVAKTILQTKKNQKLSIAEMQVIIQQRQQMRELWLQKMKSN